MNAGRGSNKSIDFFFASALECGVMVLVVLTTLAYSTQFSDYKVPKIGGVYLVVPPPGGGGALFGACSPVGPGGLGAFQKRF